MKSKTIKAILSLSIIGTLAGTIFIGNADADLFGYKRKSGGNFSAWYDSSVASYGYTGAYDTARSNWGGITSKVSIGKTSSPDGYSTDEFYVGTTSDPKLMGSNTSYTVAWPVNNPVNRYEKNWDYSVNSLYHNNVYVPSNDAATAFKARYTTTHEIGHSLGLDHTTGTNAQNSLMKGSFTGSETSHSPTTYDKNQLKSLYGN
ncbi:matrixin family metalloprotease [Paenibacillus sp. FSL P4-0338]|uniref:matrixin family metalloprotease n=1 Tax=unclassified Paenibacillus TaxID=185978 RepID=UPI00138E1679|nr:matrixin family metalloprotease [Paenibacillus sp. FSL R7-269]